MPVGLLTTTLLDNGHNTATDARATRCDSIILHKDGLCSGMSVTTHVEDNFCDSKPEKTLYTRIHTREKRGRFGHSSIV